jgi:tetratricopeptide (TPR) repeat protein
MNRWTRRFGLACCAALLWAAQSHAQVTLSPAEMRELAGQAVLQGQAGLAFDLSGALIARDETDLNAHLIRSRAARDLGRNQDALTHATKSWALAVDQNEKYASALATAQALSSSGRRTTAQLWLRRAIELAPNDALKARAAEDFRYVRARNPWSTSLSFSIAPSSNINNGSRNETSQLFDLPFEFALEGEARALSGVEVATGISSRYRLVANDRKRTDLMFGGSHRTYLLSEDAKDIAPDADGSDFATTSIFAGIQETYRLPDPKAQMGWDLRLGSTWYSGEELLKYARLGATYQRVVGKRGVADFSLSREVQNGANGRDDATIWSGRLGYGLSLKSGNRLYLSTNVTRSESNADYLDYSRQEIAARYSLANLIGPAQLEFGLSLAEKRHDVSNLTADGRQERTVNASVTAALPKLDYYGFIPTVTLRAERTDANLNLYETESFGVQVGIRSAF